MKERKFLLLSSTSSSLIFEIKAANPSVDPSHFNNCLCLKKQNFSNQSHFIASHFLNLIFLSLSQFSAFPFYRTFQLSVDHIPFWKSKEVISVSRRLQISESSAFKSVLGFGPKLEEERRKRKGIQTRKKRGCVDESVNDLSSLLKIERKKRNKTHSLDSRSSLSSFSILSVLCEN